MNFLGENNYRLWVMKNVKKKKGGGVELNYYLSLPGELFVCYARGEARVRGCALSIHAALSGAE